MTKLDERITDLEGKEHMQVRLCTACSGDSSQGLSPFVVSCWSLEQAETRSQHQTLRAGTGKCVKQLASSPVTEGVLGTGRCPHAEGQNCQ